MADLVLVAGVVAVFAWGFWKLNKQFNEYEEVSEPFDDELDMLFRRHGIDASELGERKAARVLTLRLLDRIDRKLDHDQKETEKVD